MNTYLSNVIFHCILSINLINVEPIQVGSRWNQRIHLGIEASAQRTHQYPYIENFFFLCEFADEFTPVLRLRELFINISLASLNSWRRVNPTATIV